MEDHIKLFIPGPTEVKEENLQAMARPMIGHRSEEFSQLLESIVEKLQKLLFTKNKIFVVACSSTGIMEAAVRNCVKDKLLLLENGAFSKRWGEIAKANGKNVDIVEVPWGKAATPQLVEEKLKEGGFDAIALVHNETSTGVMNPIEEIAEVVKKYPDVCFLVDAVSSMAGVKIEVDKLGIDVILAGVQKCFALPPGITVVSVSEKAFKKAKIVENKGYYFDFLIHSYYWDQKRSTPATPSISHLFALNNQLNKILEEEGLEKRFKKHKEMAELVRGWAKENFALFAEEAYLSDTVTAVKNIKGLDIGELKKELNKRGKEISNGYGRLKGECFRIAHMGDIEEGELKGLLRDIEEISNIK